MVFLNEHFKEIEKHLELPQEAIKLFEDTALKMENDEDFSRKFADVLNRYMFPQAHDFNKCCEEINNLAPLIETHEYTLNFVFLIIAAEIMRQRYKDAELSDALFWETIKDLRWKFDECVNCKEVYGTFVADWNTAFYALRRFTMGRFQFEYANFNECDEYITSAGVKIKRGDKTLGFHIPSSGVPLTDDVRLQSYKKAYDFFSDYRRDDGLMIFECGSWLLYKGYENCLPENSNTLKFISDFEIIRTGTSEKFNDAWRVFGKYGYCPPEEWPEKTSMQRAFKKYVLDGNKTGHGHGIIVFDGEKIIR